MRKTNKNKMLNLMRNTRHKLLGMGIHACQKARSFVCTLLIVFKNKTSLLFSINSVKIGSDATNSRCEKDVKIK